MLQTKRAKSAATAPGVACFEKGREEEVARVGRIAGVERSLMNDENYHKEMTIMVRKELRGMTRVPPEGRRRKQRHQPCCTMMCAASASAAEVRTAWETRPQEVFLNALRPSTDNNSMVFNDVI